MTKITAASLAEEAAQRSRAELNQFKREKFAKAWVSSSNMAKAAKMAGISAPAAKKFLGEQGVQDLIEQERERIAKRMDLDADFVLGEIQQVAIECRADQNHRDALKALELLGKHLKLFVDKENHTGASVSFNLSLDGSSIENGTVIEGDTVQPDVYDHELDFDVPEELKSLSAEELEYAMQMNQVEEEQPYGIFDIDLGAAPDENDET